MPKNPSWARDELILALDLYFQFSPSHISRHHPEIVALSAFLNELPVHDGAQIGQDFRNPNSVYMKMCNFLHLDPDYDGEGLSSVGRLDREIWNEFGLAPDLLARTAEAIRSNYAIAAHLPRQSDIYEDEFAEGRILTRIHRLRERNATLVKRKKETVLRLAGLLACEVCSFDFERFYGEIGRGFAECHHKMPLSQLRPKHKTHLDDLAIVCSNCHRIIHRTHPMVSVEELRVIVLQRF